MLLKEILLDKVNYVEVSGFFGNVQVEHITRDSRDVRENTLFFAVVGENIDGHDFIADVEKKGASVIVHSNVIENYADNVAYVKVEDVRVAMAEISKVFFNVDKEMTILGVTGTNGKTTTTSMIKQILEKAGNKVGLIGTIANYIGSEKIDTERTTPESIELFKLINDMKQAGCNYCVMEVSSHASVLDRTRGLDFLTGAFTNLTQDHLDFHKTFEEYYAAKYKFVESAMIPIINVDDNYGVKMCGDLKTKGLRWASYGMDSNELDIDYKASNVEYSANESRFTLEVRGCSLGEFIVPIPGKYNVYNALAVIASVLEDDLVSVEDLRNAFASMGAVDGRCEKVDVPTGNCTVVVDYAHTPDGLENILKTMKEITKGRLITVFGCGGNRDAKKRPLMAKEACLYSDFVVVTSDNPRHENPTDIIKDISVGLSGEYVIMEDRKCAIEYALRVAKQDDVVVIAGKGHETYQIIGDEKVYFSDKEVVLNYFR